MGLFPLRPDDLFVGLLLVLRCLQRWACQMPGYVSREKELKMLDVKFSSFHVLFPCISKHEGVEGS